MNDADPKIEPSLGLLADLAAKGVNLSDDHEVEHFFLAGEEFGEQLAHLLADKGYQVELISLLPDEDGEGENHMVGITLVHPIDEQSIVAAIQASCGVGDALGLEYDGWDVDISRWKINQG